MTAAGADPTDARGPVGLFSRVASRFSQFDDTTRRRFAQIVGVVGVVAVHLLNDFSNAGVPAAVDELGYMGNARYLTGGESVLEWGRSPYRLGYSMLLTPITAFAEDPATIYQWALNLNALLAGVLFLLLLGLSTSLGVDRIGVACVVAATGAVMPAMLIYGNTAFSEVFLATTFAGWCLTVVGLHRRPGLARSWALLGAMTALTYFAHGRFVGILAVMVVLLAVHALGAGRRVALWSLPAYAVCHIVLRVPSAPRSSRAVGSEARRLWSNAFEHPGTVVDTLLGQGWMILVSTALVPAIALGALVASRRLRRELAEQGPTLLAIGVAAIAMWMVSSLFMAPGLISRDEFTFMVYERYNSAAVPVVVVVSLAVLYRARSGVPLERATLLGLAPVAIGLLVLMSRRSDYFERVPFLLNTPTLAAYTGRGVDDLWIAAILAGAVGLVLCAALWVRPLPAVAGGLVLALLVAADIQDRSIEPYYAERARQANLVAVYDSIPLLSGQPVALDSRVVGEYHVYLYSWLRPSWELGPVDVTTDDAPIVVSTLARMGSDPRARLLGLENAPLGYGGVGLALFARDESLIEDLEAAGMLAPPGFAGDVDEAYYEGFDAELTILTPPLRSTADAWLFPLVEVSNTGTVPWFNERQLKTIRGALRVGVRVWANGELVTEGRGFLSSGLLRGESEVVTVPIRLDASVRPGTYEVQFTPMAEQVAWFDAASVETELVVEP